MRMFGESENQRMARLCTPAMNSINSDPRFTTESQEDFQTERLPTLDFEVWIENNKIRHSYYQKPMKTPFVLMSRSGMSYRQKFQILSNELSRRLSNIQIEEIPHKEVIEIIEQFIKELKSSEYNQKQAKEIVTSGIRGWKRKLEKRKKHNIPFYRLAQETDEERLRKELTEKESWYKDNNEDNETTPVKFRRLEEGRRIPTASCRTGSRRGFQKGQKNTYIPRSPLFLIWE